MAFSRQAAINRQIKKLKQRLLIQSKNGSVNRLETKNRLDKLEKQNGST